MKIATLQGVTDISSGLSTWHSIAKTEWTVYAWGSNTSGQLGIGNNVDSNKPEEILTLRGEHVKHIYASGHWKYGTSFIVTGKHAKLKLTWIRTRKCMVLGMQQL
jgi:alpha-tubulin suppressor-like RCC1 family protein